MNKNKKTKKNLFICMVLLALVCAAAFYLLNKSKSNTPDSSGQNSVINYGPPTNEERVAGDEQKEAIKQRDELNTQRDEAPENATVVITDAGQYDNTIEVRSFIPDNYEDGSCTISITKQNLSVSKKTSAHRDATTTICTNPLFLRAEFEEEGDWRVEVTYQSDSGVTGVSEPKYITIE